MVAATEIAVAALNARESLKDLRNMAASVGCTSQVKKIAEALIMIRAVEQVLTAVVENSDVVVNEAMRGAA